MKLAKDEFGNISKQKGMDMTLRNVFSAIFVLLLIVTLFFKHHLTETFLWTANVGVVVAFSVAVFLSLFQVLKRKETRDQSFQLAKSVFLYGVVLSLLIALTVAFVLHFFMRG